jgi:hypothetical protein
LVFEGGANRSRNVTHVVAPEDGTPPRCNEEGLGGEENLTILSDFIAKTTTGSVFETGLW